jgi:hypothetical protein
MQALQPRKPERPLASATLIDVGRPHRPIIAPAGGGIREQQGLELNARFGEHAIRKETPVHSKDWN